MGLVQSHEGADKCQVPEERCGPALTVNLWFFDFADLHAGPSASPSV